jgi:hypothetical protein
MELTQGQALSKLRTAHIYVKEVLASNQTTPLMRDLLGDAEAEIHDAISELTD